MNKRGLSIPLILYLFFCQISFAGVKDIPFGKNFPSEVNALIEISQNSSGVKYEFDTKSEVLFVDRFLTTSMHYPANYGFIPNTLEGDGDPLDILIISTFQIQPSAFIAARVVGVLLMEDNKGKDYKIIAVPAESVTGDYSHIKDIKDISKLTLQKIKHFFEHYNEFEKEKGKWVKVGTFKDKEEAKKIILKARENYKKKLI